MKSYILPVTSNSRGGLILTGFLAVVSLFAVSSDTRYLLAPILATLFIALLFWLTLSDRRGGLPLADPATLIVLSTVCYTIFPPLQYLLSNMRYTIASALPLYIYAPTSEQLGAFTWWYVVYLLSFVIGYLFLDSTNTRLNAKPMPPDQGTVRSFILLFIIFSITMFAIELLYGINLYGIYDAKLYESYDALLAMPLFFRQFYGIIGHNGIFFIVKIGLLLTIFLNWGKPVYRYTLYAWLGILLVKNILLMGARTELVLTFMCSAIVYHQFVKPLKRKMILCGGIILFAGFMIMGMMRGQATLGENIEQLKNTFESSEIVFSINNEFQALFGGNYDLAQMRRDSIIGDAPLQLILFDLIMLIPQQLISFEKLRPDQWYMNLSYNPGYFMFNTISQSIIGFGWIELILRGLFLGLVFAKLRAWYIRRSSSFWVTLFYFYIVSISYYMIRGTAIYVLLASILYRFIPLYLLVRFLNNRRRGVPTTVPVSSRAVDA